MGELEPMQRTHAEQLGFAEESEASIAHMEGFTFGAYLVATAIFEKLEDGGVQAGLNEVQKIYGELLLWKDKDPEVHHGHS